MKNMVQKIIRGDQVSGARLMRLLEESNPAGVEMLKLLYPSTGNSYLIGLTGPPGSGKSTLVNCIIGEFRQRGLKVAVLAIDPSSPLSGGALLGDRIRMRSHSKDDGVFIRSMATRGHLGGISKTTREAALVCDAMGFEVIVIETVGVGQGEVEISQLAHTSAIVNLPETGDEIQLMKAGLLEIGDVMIVNKADRPGADKLVDQLRSMLEMKPMKPGGWHPPVIKTIATERWGIAELVDTFDAHYRSLVDTGKFGEHHYQQEFDFFQSHVMKLAAAKVFDNIGDSNIYHDILEGLKKRTIDPVTAAELMTDRLHFRH